MFKKDPFSYERSGGTRFRGLHFALSPRLHTIAIRLGKPTVPPTRPQSWRLWFDLPSWQASQGRPCVSPCGAWYPEASLPHRRCQPPRNHSRPAAHQPCQSFAGTPSLAHQGRLLRTVCGAVRETFHGCHQWQLRPNIPADSSDSGPA